MSDSSTQPPSPPHVAAPGNGPSQPDPDGVYSVNQETLGRSKLPLREAIAFSFQSLTLRLGRMVVVVLGIAFAIAFLAVLLGTESIMSGLRQMASQAANADQEGAAAQGQTFRLWWMVVALLIAVTGITNAVLMMVTERVKEIGTLKCLGARGLHIVEIFLFEMLLLGAVGGLLGGILGVLATMTLFLAQLGNDLWLVFGWTDALRMIGLSFLVSMGVSLISAILPVALAARVEPAEAMRYEV